MTLAPLSRTAIAHLATVDISKTCTRQGAHPAVLRSYGHNPHDRNMCPRRPSDGKEMQKHGFLSARARALQCSPYAKYHAHVCCSQGHNRYTNVDARCCGTNIEIPECNIFCESPQNCKGWQSDFSENLLWGKDAPNK